MHVFYAMDFMWKGAYQVFGIMLVHETYFVCMISWF
jgi:hypothetical protein